MVKERLQGGRTVERRNYHDKKSSHGIRFGRDEIMTSSNTTGEMSIARLEYFSIFIANGLKGDRE